MKFLSWIMNFQVRYYRHGRRYARGGVANRVFNMIILTALVGGSLFLEYFSLKMVLGDGNIIGIFLIVIAFACLMSTLELCSVYTYFGFKSASKDTLAKWLEKSEAKRRAKKHIESNIEEVTTSDTNRRCPRWLDIFTGVYFLCLTIGEIALAILLFGLI